MDFAVFNPRFLKQLSFPAFSSHKGQNGKLLIIGGSHLFHAASLWALNVASKIVDMVFYSSVSENNEIVLQAKKEFRNGIVIPRANVVSYIEEVDCILIGPGLPRESGRQKGDDDTKTLTESLLIEYPAKKWVIDGGSLQTIDPNVLLRLKEMPILTPHQKEFETMKLKIKNSKAFPLANLKNGKVEMQSLELREQAMLFAKEYHCVVLLKGQEDIICSPAECIKVSGGNAGMTKGGTGDVLAGLVAALYCANGAFLSAAAASYINKKAGDSLFERAGYYFNASDLAEEIPKVMKELLIH